MILPYRELVNDPISVVQRFYEQFGYKDYPDLTDDFMAGIKATEARRSKHEYSFEEMGFTRAGIIKDYADIFERFGFDKREPVEVVVEEPVPEAAD